MYLAWYTLYVCISSKYHNFNHTLYLQVYMYTDTYIRCNYTLDLRFSMYLTTLLLLLLCGSTERSSWPVQAMIYNMPNNVLLKHMYTNALLTQICNALVSTQKFLALETA